MDIAAIAPRKTADRTGFTACLVAIGLCATASAQNSLLDAVQSRLGEHPHETHLHYYAATLYAREHRWPEANQALDALLRANWRAGVDPAQFSGHETQRAVAEKVAALQRRTERGFRNRLTFSLVERDLIPEGIAYDARTDTLLRDVLILNLPLGRRASSSANDCAAPD